MPVQPIVQAFEVEAVAAATPAPDVKEDAGASGHSIEHVGMHVPRAGGSHIVLGPCSKAPSE